MAKTPYGVRWSMERVFYWLVRGEGFSHPEQNILGDPVQDCHNILALIVVIVGSSSAGAKSTCISLQRENTTNTGEIGLHTHKRQR